MVLNALFSIGLLLTSCSQLRFLGVAGVGPGEILLLVWLVSMLIREVARLGPPLTPALSRLLVFWALFLAAECFGTLAGFVLQDRHDPIWFLHDVFAYSMMAPLSCLCLAKPAAEQRLRQAAWLISVGGSVLLAVQIANALYLRHIPVVDPWYWDRLRGWSQNPNQLAFLCVALGALSLHLAETSCGNRKIAALACMPLPIAVGFLTKSDTFIFVLALGSLAYLFLKIRQMLCRATSEVSGRSAFAWILVGALPLILIAAAPLAAAIAAGTMDFAKHLSKDSGKDAEQEMEVRLNLWTQAITRGFDSGMLGLGPGPHLQIPLSLVEERAVEDEPKNLVHPEPGDAPNFEAHNTFLDLFVQGGLLAVLSFAWLAGSTISATYRGRRDALVVLLGGLVVFGMVHFIIRQPIFWFAIALCSVTPVVRRSDAAPAARILLKAEV
jgi:hypothetical protein